METKNSFIQCVMMPLSLEEATSAIIKRTKQLVDQLIEERGNDIPPFQPVEYARLQGIKRIEKADFKNTSAILLRLHDDCIIKVNKNQHPYRQNFSCAHEIGHILFDELGLIDYVRKIEYRTYNPGREQEIRAKTRERLCDVAATELIMPEKIFKKYLINFGISVNSIKLLSNLFEASIPAVTIRIEEVCPETCIALKWELRKRRGFKSLHLSKPYKKCIPKHKQAKPDSSLFKAFETDSIVKCYKDFKIGTEVKRLPMESKGFGYGENRRVYSLAFLER